MSDEQGEEGNRIKTNEAYRVKVLERVNNSREATRQCHEHEMKIGEIVIMTGLFEECERKNGESFLCEFQSRLINFLYPTPSQWQIH